ncbi:MAG: MFS transporter [Planctomycetota bacterium]
MTERSKAIVVLTMNTLAFTVCFACWMLNGVLATFLVDNGVFAWNKAEIGWLIGIPVLTGSIMRLPVGVLTDRYGGRKVYALLMLIAAVPTWLLGYATTYPQFLLASFGFGLSGASFAVGIAYSSIWFSKQRQGLALGIFGAGNAGAAVTSLGAPVLLKYLTSGGTQVEQWRMLPRIYAIALAVTAVVFFFATFERKVSGAAEKTLRQRLAPLKEVRVWRFGLYYFFVFGGFVALSQWLIPYYLNVYAMSLATAGLMASIFSLPSGVIRALGGWVSDRIGARAAMYWVLGASLLCCFMLVIPRMDIQAPGPGVMAPAPGTVQSVSNGSIALGKGSFALRTKPTDSVSLMHDPDALIWPRFEFWQEPIVKVGQQVKRKELLARGITHVYFQANVWIFTALVFALGIAMGVGKAAVYKHIPEYFPSDVGVVGGIVGVLGGLGGFFGPIIFGYLLEGTGIWTTCWMFFLLLTAICLVWMHLVVRKIMKASAPELLHQIEHVAPAAPASPLAERGSVTGEPVTVLGAAP